MQLLNNVEAWIAIGISVFFLVVGVLMKRAFIQILKASPSPQGMVRPSTPEPGHD